MHFLEAKVVEIQEKDLLHLVSFDLGGVVLEMMSLELPLHLKEGSRVKLAVKPMSVAVGKAIEGVLSHSNQFPVTVTEMQQGALLSTLSLKLENGRIIESVITRNALETLALTLGDSVTAIIQASDLSIMEVCDV